MIVFSDLHNSFSQEMFGLIERHLRMGEDVFFLGDMFDRGEERNVSDIIKAFIFFHQTGHGNLTLV